MALNQGLCAPCSLDNQYQNFLASFYLSTKMLMANFFSEYSFGGFQTIIQNKNIECPQICPLKP